MNGVSVIVVGIDGWFEFTLPLIKDIGIYEPEVKLVVVDNASVIAYPVQESSLQVVRVDERVSYAAAINIGMRAAPDSDRYIILNNDVRCCGPFADIACTQRSDEIGGNTLNRKDRRMWIDGWHYCIPGYAWDVVGEFDERFEVAAFEDADWTFRALEKGFRLLKTDHPFEHLWTHQRHSASEFWEKRRKNFEYLCAKHDLKGWEL